MSANVETMMYVGEKPWHGLGVKVEKAQTETDPCDLETVQYTVSDPFTTGSPPSAASCSATWGDFTMRASSPDMRLMMGAGVPAGAAQPCQVFRL